MVDETAAEIQAMQTHSSSVVAVKAARALESLLSRDYATVEEYVRTLDRNSDALRRANPSHASLQTSQRQILDVVTDATPASVAEAKERTQAAIDEVVEDIELGKERAAGVLAEHLTDGQTVLTHDYSSTVLDGIKQATRDGASFTVYVTEARPRVLGRKTARTLGTMDGLDVHLIADSACGIYLERCEEVLFGMDCIVDDVLYNRVGTYPIAATAADRGVDVTVVGSSAKLVDEGFRFENDFRSVSEVIREPPEGFSVENPAYDATPVRLVDTLVTDEGVERP